MFIQILAILYLIPALSGLSGYETAESTLTLCQECGYRPGKGKLDGVQCLECMCDNQCIIYGDCCVDILLKFKLHTQIPNTTFSCVPPEENRLRFKDIDLQHGYYMVTSFFINRERKQACDLDNVFPVTSIVSNRTYINKECAISNREMSFLLWTRKHECENGRCVLMLNPPETRSLRICHKLRAEKVISSCAYNDKLYQGNLTGYNASKEKCKRYHVPIYSDHTQVVYQNLYCYFCTGAPLGLINGEGKHVFRALTRFGEDFAPENSILKCDGTKEWMDSTAMRCREVRCFGNQKPLKGECDVQHQEAYGNGFMMKLMLEIWEKGNIRNIQRQIVTNSFAPLAYELHAKYYNLEITKPYISQKSALFYIKCLFSVTDNVTLVELQRDIYQFKYRTSTTGGIHSNYTLVNWDPTNLLYSTFYETDKDNGLCCADNSGPASYEKGDYTLVSDQLTCANIEFDEHEYHIDFPVVIIPHLNVTLLSTQYYINEWNKLVVCLQDVQSILNRSYINDSSLYIIIPTPLNRHDYISWYMTLTCVPLSLFCLAISFFTFIINADMRTLPGKTNIGLVLSLFFAQLVLLCGLDNSKMGELCQVIGMTIHWLWLSTILWMNVCSYHMFKVFVIRKLTRSSTGGHFKQMMKYIAYAHGIPLMIVSATVISNLAISNGHSTGYGGIVCYLKTKLLIGLCFVLPLSVVVISNILFFVFTILAIGRVEQTGKQSGVERNNIYIYIKLSVVTGLFWLVAILSEVLDNAPMEYISIILNGLQGVFLFLAFSCNRRVLRSLQLRYGTATSSSEEPKTNSNAYTISSS